MASRSFDGKAALLFRQGLELTRTLWRHLADSGHAAGGGDRGGRGEKKRELNGRCAIRLTEGVEKNTTFPAGPRGLRRVDWGTGNQTGSEAAAELGFPGCPASGCCARISGAGAFGAGAKAGLDFPGSRRGSLRRAGAREPRSEVAEAAAQASGSSWSSPFLSVSAAPAAGPAASGPIDMAAVLQQVLERTELNKLPKSVQNKLEKFLADQQSEIDGLKGRHEKFKVESGKWRSSSRS